MQWNRSGIFFIFIVLLLTTGCQIAQNSFTRTVSNAGAAFAAASTTLTYTHMGKITTAYARSSFEVYQGELSGIDQQISPQQGVADTRTVQHLLDLYKPAMQAVNQPCLESSCDWHAQVAALDHASEAFLKAGGQ